MARILCDTCGPDKPVSSPVYAVSPDYNPSHHAEFVARAIWVTYVYLDETVDGYLLSPEFVAREQVIVGPQPLPDDYPEWIHKAAMVCATCFNKLGRPSKWPE